jgi:hypothetical protein
VSDLAVASTLHPRLRDQAVLHALRDAWVAGGDSIRIESVLAPALADALAACAWSELAFVPFHMNDDTYGRCFLWRSVQPLTDHVRGQRLRPPLDRAADFVTRDLPWLVNELTGRQTSVPELRLGFCWLSKGCYIDVHNDMWDRPALGWVLGLTPDPWPEDDGGHLTFYAEDKTTPIGSRPPGWDTLDLYTVQPYPRWHAVPLLRTARKRMTLTGLLTDPPVPAGPAP